MLELRGIAKVWPRLSIRAELILGEAETVSILGPSGCGKSTLLRIVAGLERPDEGRVLLDGVDLTALPPERRGIGMVFQDFALFPNMSAKANIEYGPRVRGLPRAERERIARALAASLGIEALLDRGPSSLSGGEQQRVALARTLAASPRIVLLDEPLSSLDYGLRRRLRSEIAARVREAGAASLHVTHDVEEAFAVADRVVLMREGKIVAQGSPEELFSAPRDSWTASFLGLGPVLPVSRIVRESEGGPFLALTPLGGFAFDGVLPAASPDGGGLGLFFPAGAARTVPPRPTTDRPESDAGPGRTAAANTLAGRVAFASFAGDKRRVAVDCGKLRIELDMPSSYKPAPGDPIVVEIDARACRVLPGSPPEGGIKE